eukprot:TRINITY_DN2037_c0_g1_i5.p1 TRINITY_DN2037_c0_g1~~TRINITY_DN2037_c0_g1_i5.p1  ORF type:complete len:169 (+),score=8.90 TRINITY_DN2037_c0_g1_i5:101-607(+)
MGNKKIFAIACAVCCVLSMVTLAVCLYYYIPREPDINVDQSRTKVNSYAFTPLPVPNRFVADMTIYLVINNPNYVDLSIASINWDIYHGTDYVGNVPDQQACWNKRANDSNPLNVLLSVSDPGAVARLYTDSQDDGKVTLRFTGPIKVKYGAITSPAIPIDFTQDVSL